MLMLYVFLNTDDMLIAILRISFFWNKIEIHICMYNTYYYTYIDFKYIYFKYNIYYII